MRNPNRIKIFCDQLAEIWKDNCPDWRFGQLICNVFGSFDIDPFFPEEEQMIKMIRAYFEPKGENSDEEKGESA